MILLKDINFGFGERTILDNINIAIKANDKIGLIGRNGVGKSTLFKLIMGELALRSGSVDIPKEYTIAYLEQDRDFRSEASVVDYVVASQKELLNLNQELAKVQQQLDERTDYDSDSYMQLITKMTDLNDMISLSSPEEVTANAEMLLKGLGFKQHELNQPLTTFSGGWQMRAKLASILLRKPNLLLLDEPTNYLDIESIIWFESYLRDYPGSFVIISHDTDFLDNTTKSTVELLNGGLQVYHAPYSKAQEERGIRLEQLKSAFLNQQKVIEQKQRTIERFRASATKTSMAQSMEKQLDKMQKIEWQEESTSEIKISFLEPPRSAGVVIKADNLAKSYGEKQVFTGIDFDIERGQRVALVGQNGQGKSTLIKLITQKIEASTGTIELGKNVFHGIFYQDHTNGMDGNMTVLETLESNCPPELRTKLRNILGGFLFSGEDVEKKVKVLSGGEKTRLCLADLLLRPYNLIILDEPTNHLDMASKLVLQDALNRFKGTLLVVSHDRFFLRGLTETTIELRDGQLSTYLGDIDYFLQKRNADNFREVELGKQEKQKKKATVTKAPIDHGKLKELKKQIANIERKISQKEDKVKKLEQKMAEPDFFQSTTQDKVIQEHGQLKVEISELNEKWDVLAESIIEVES